MRLFTLAAASLLLGGSALALAVTLLSAPRAAAEDAAPAAEEKLGPAPQGLVLDAQIVGRKAIQPGESPEVVLRLRNESKDRRIPVVLPNDGSESGWREPHVFWTGVHVAADGTERPLEKLPLGRCGLFAVEWQKDVVTLEAGEARELKSWLPVLRTIFDLQEKGRVRLVAHYVYRRGAAAKGDALTPERQREGTGGMGDTPAFELVSKPVEFTVERPLDVVVEVKRKVRAGKPFAVADVLAAKVVNASGKATSLRPQEWTAYVEIDSRAIPPQFDGVTDVTAADDAPAIALPADGSFEIYGPGARLPRQTMNVTFAKAGTARVAIRLIAAGSGPRIRSAWADLVVEE